MENLENHLGCVIYCNCGGKIMRLCDDEAYYWLTERKTLIFRGHCNLCTQVVSVERDIQSLLMLCPDKDGTKCH